jgi:hypothetical protein
MGRIWDIYGTYAGHPTLYPCATNSFSLIPSDDDGSFSSLVRGSDPCRGSVNFIRECQLSLGNPWRRLARKRTCEVVLSSRFEG